MGEAMKPQSEDKDKEGNDEKDMAKEREAFASGGLLHSLCDEGDYEQLVILGDELGFDKQQLHELPFFLPYLLDAWNFTESLANGELNWVKLSHGDQIVTPDESATLKCIRTPGHAIDHFGFILEEEKALLSGDHVLGVGTTVIGDMHDYMNSLSLMMDESPRWLLPGHGPMIPNGMDLLKRYVRHRRAREWQLWSELSPSPGEPTKAPLSSLQLATALYTSTAEKRLYLASQNCFKILMGLWKDGSCRAFLRDQAGAEGAQERWSLVERGEDLLRYSYTQLGEGKLLSVRWVAVNDAGVQAAMVARATEAGLGVTVEQVNRQSRL